MTQFQLNIIKIIKQIALTAKFKRGFGILFGLLLSCSVFAQPTNGTVINGNDTIKPNIAFDTLSQKAHDALLTNPEQSVKFGLKALQNADTSKVDKNELIRLYNTIGTAYYFLNNYIESINFHEKELSLIEFHGTEPELMKSAFNLATMHRQMGNYDKAIEYFQLSLDIAQYYGIHDVVLRNYEILYRLYYEMGNYKEAFDMFQDYIEMKDENILTIYENEKDEAAELLENKEEILRDIERQIAEKEKILNEAIEKEKQLQKDTMEKGKEIEQLSQETKKLDKEVKEKEEKVKEQQKLIVMFASIFLIILVFSLLLYYQYRAKKKANEQLALKNEQIMQQTEEISAQRDEIEKQKDKIMAQRDFVMSQRDQIAAQKQKITDSIQYASNIQAAILPPEEFINEVIPEHFILYKPKYIISGDFYWIKQRGNKILVAGADCTGHGVPGAFMSMLGVTFLNEVINENISRMGKLTLRADEILNLLREKVIKLLHQTGKQGEAKDGMDVAFCIIDTEKKTLQFAGAYSPMYLVRKYEPDTIDEKYINKLKDKRIAILKLKNSAWGILDEVFPTSELAGISLEDIDYKNDVVYELIHIKGDRMPIGIYFREVTPFTYHNINLQEGDTIYLFSDGYIDQFGEKNSRKFLARNFKKLLLNIQETPLRPDKSGKRTQKDILNHTIEEWRGSHEQIDDMLVMGINICFEKFTKKKKKKYNWKGKSILVVDDDIENFEFIKLLLSPTQMKVIWAKNAKEALQICCTDTGEQVDIVMLDMDLPEMQAYRAIGEIKKSNPRLPVIAQISHAIIDQKEKSIEAGCNDYITVPLKSKNLIGVISKYIK